MSNTYITPSVIAKAALATLYNTIVLAGLVHRDYDDDFSGKVGDTITVRTPAVFTANTFSRVSGITLQDVVEGSLTVSLDTILDVSFPVTAEELTLKIDDFENRLLVPAMEAIAQKIDLTLSDTLVAQARASHAGKPVTGAYLTDGSSTPNKAFRDARAILSRNKLPLNDRVAVLSPEAVAKSVLADSLFVQAQMSGTTDALRNATVGKAFGFDTYETQTLGYGSTVSGSADGLAFHRDSVVLVMRTLQTPNGVSPSQAAARGYKGLGLRIVQQYDITHKQDVCSIDALIGSKNLRTEAAVELNFGQGS